MTSISSTVDVQFKNLWEHLQTRGIKSRRRLAVILERDPSVISNFFNGKANNTTVISVCADINKMFGVAVIGYPSNTGVGQND